jgi:hypothetical protein
MWHELLQVKTSREQQAQRALARRRAEQASALQCWQGALERLRQHRRFADEQECALFMGLLQQQVRLRDIEAVQHTLAQLKIQDHQLDSACAQAQASHAEAERQTACALDVQRGAGRVKEKFAELAARHRAAGDQEARRVEDLEQEEVGSLRGPHEGNDPWDAA